MRRMLTKKELGGGSGGASASIIHVGADQKYITLRAGMEAAKELSEKGTNVTVIVHPGTYDLKKEFAAEVAAGITKKTITGNFIGNNMYVKFMGGAQVYAYFDDASEQKYLTAFYSDNNTNFTLEGANIEVSGIGYCLYDKCDTASHTLINCHMIGRCQRSTNISEVVKIELGTDAYISIQGGIYCHDTYSSSDKQYPIRFVNTSSNIYTTSHIYIDHVNLVKTRTGFDGTGILYFSLPSSGSIWNSKIIVMVSNSQMYDEPYMAKGKVEYLGNWNNVYTKPAA